MLSTQKTLQNNRKDPQSHLMTQKRPKQSHLRGGRVPARAFKKPLELRQAPPSTIKVMSSNDVNFIQIPQLKKGRMPVLDLL